MRKSLEEKIIDVSTFYLEFLKRNSPSEYTTATYTCLEPMEILNHIEMYFKNRIGPPHEL